ncbi:hypothetical protein V8F33_013874 [Rhypophila sp. PSN 637]
MGSNNPTRGVGFLGSVSTTVPHSSDNNMTDILHRIRYLQESLRSAEAAVQKQKHEVYEARSGLIALGPGPHSKTYASKLELETSHLKYLELVVSDFKTKIEQLNCVKLMQAESDYMEAHRLHTSSVEDNTSGDDIDGMDTPSTTGTADWDDLGSRSSEKGETPSTDSKDSEEGQTKMADCDSVSLRNQGPGEVEAEALAMRRLLGMYGPDARPRRLVIFEQPEYHRAVKTHIGGSHAEPIVKEGDIFMVCARGLWPAPDSPEIPMLGYNPHNMTVGELPHSSLRMATAFDLALDPLPRERYKSSIWMALVDFAAAPGGDDESDSADDDDESDSADDDDDDGEDGYGPYNGTLAWQEGDYVRLYHAFNKFIPRGPTEGNRSVEKQRRARPSDDDQMRVGFNLRTRQFGYFAGWSEDDWRFVDGDL